jgi:hypothetical protein
MSGTTWTGIAERGGSEPEARACLALPELERILTLAIDDYNHATQAATSERSSVIWATIAGRICLMRSAFRPDYPRIVSYWTFCRSNCALRRTGLALFKVDYSSLWRRDNQQPVERVVVYDLRSLARVWLLDDTTDDYRRALRVPQPDMTLAEARKPGDACGHRVRKTEPSDGCLRTSPKSAPSRNGHAQPRAGERLSEQGWRTRQRARVSQQAWREWPG